MNAKYRLTTNGKAIGWSKMALALALLLGTAGIAAAQSNDRDNPTPLTSNTIKGTGIGKTVEYYYNFTAGPGEVVITIDLKAKTYSTVADIELFDADSKKIFYYYPNAGSTSERTVQRLNLSSKQTLTLRLAFDSKAGEFQIKFGGAVELAAPDASAGAVTPPAETSAGATSTPPANAQQPQPTEGTPQSDPSVTSPTQSSGQKSGKESKLDLGINLLQTVGTHFGLPSSGVLHIVMKDGTTQDIDLSQVKIASVKKQ